MEWTLDEGLEELSCGGLLILAESSADPDLAPFVGSVHLGESFLLRTSAGTGGAPVGETRLGYLTAMERDEAARCGLAVLEPTLLGVDKERAARGSSGFWSAVLSRAFVLAGLEPTRVALGGRYAVGSAQAALADLSASGWSFADGRALLLRYRKRKSAREEIAARRAAAGACVALRRCAQVLAEAEIHAGQLYSQGRPLRVGDLRREIASNLASHGLGQPLGNIVATGADSAVPHSQGDDEFVLRAGETVVVDLFPKGQIFADCTRTFCVGPPPAEVERAHERVLEALRSASSAAVAGCRLWDLQRQTCEHFEAAGVPTPLSVPETQRGYVHGLGHGVGYELHEYPSFSVGAGSEGLLEVGDLFTLEPGIYEPAVGYGVRLEDLMFATEHGVENLTPLPYELDPARW